MTETLHVHPERDSITHDTSDTSDKCPCGPSLRAVVKDGEIKGHVFIHNRM